MGAGGNATTRDSNVPSMAPISGKEIKDRAPSVKPPFTISDLKRAIPPHCFRRSLLRSLSHLALDLLIAASLFYVAVTYFDNPTFLSKLLPPQLAPLLTPAISVALWAAYIAAQGCFCTGIWVLAHECGHGAFSDYQAVNDAFGFVLHSCLLVPYFAWKYSHRRHHSNTGSMEYDEVFVPKTLPENAPSDLSQPLSPFSRLFRMTTSLLLGWPAYLVFNKSGRKYQEGGANHFIPSSPIFNDRERLWIAVGDIGLLAVLSGLSYLGYQHGFAWLCKVYIAPLLVVNMFLVLITLLQHTHSSLPRYVESEWEWLKGALCTVDRDYGVLNHVFHHIGDTHVLHHIFSTMPFYHAEEASAAMKPILGDYYRFDGTPIVQALWRETGECRYVSEDAGGPRGIFWFVTKGTAVEGKKSQ